MAASGKNLVVKNKQNESPFELETRAPSSIRQAFTCNQRQEGSFLSSLSS
jgi:hypothetical protein